MIPPIDTFANKHHCHIATVNLPTDDKNNLNLSVKTKRLTRTNYLLNTLPITNSYQKEAGLEAGKIRNGLE